MPFLLPAVVALSSDVFILWLDKLRPKGGDEFVNDEDRFVYHVQYLIPLAVIRIILLVVPLLFHSYRGTALQCPFFYQLLYWGTLSIVLLQMLCLSLVNPASIEAIFPFAEAAQLVNPTTPTPQHHHYHHHAVRILLEHLHELRRVWWILTFTLLSDVCHLIMFWHVRSTAPSTYSYFWSFGSTPSAGAYRYTKAPSVYYALRHNIHHQTTPPLLNGSGQQQQQQQYYDYDAGSAVAQYRQYRDLSFNDNNINGAATDEPDLMHAMNEFMVELNTRLKRAKQDWTARLDDFTTRISHQQDMRVPSRNAPLTAVTSGGSTTTTTSSSNSQPTMQQQSSHPLFFHLSPFRVMLQLFAYEEVLNNGKLDAVFDLDDGAGLTFFVPQLLSFLLHGALQCSPQLEEWILNKCQRNIYFAHRCYWFLRAWCLQVPTMAPATSSNTLSRNNSDAQLSTGLAPFLDEPSSPDNHHQIECGPVTVGRRSSRSGSVQIGGNVLDDSSSQRFFSPEEHDMIERLMLRIKECGEEAAVGLEFGAKSAVVTTTPTPTLATAPASPPLGSPFGRAIRAESTASEPDVATQLSKSASSLEGAVKLGIIPVHPASNAPSLQHFNVLSAQRRYGFLPLDNTELVPKTTPPQSGIGGALQQHYRETEYFDKTPQFLDSLLFLADSLFQVPPKDRKGELQNALRALECDLLPSNAVYLPVGDVHHRVWRIVADESIAISTKERVPCIVCLEVVDVHTKRRKTHSRGGIFDRLPGKLGRSNSIDSSNETGVGDGGAADLEIQAPSSAAEPESGFVSEAELVKRWRNAPRNPQRRTSIFDKVKVVKSQVQDHLNQYRDRTVNEELQSLTLGQALVEPIPRSFVGPTTTTVTDVETGEFPQEEASGMAASEAAPSRGISRASSGASLVSMGQWSSPATEKAIIQKDLSKTLEGSFGGLRRRMDRDFEESGNGSGPLRYGSDHEEEVTSPSKSRRTSGTEATAKAPLVVFREDWSTKQERIRKKSAYGTHPGWRLLPVLVKANDDLRQEQLASALIYKMSSILAREKVNVWLYNYEILALTETGGIIEAIPDTISLDSLKKNDANFTTLKSFFYSHFSDPEDLADAKANFVESLAAYSIVCFLLQIKDRHNGNILLDNRGHLIHIDFGFFFLSSPGKNVGFESAPFKLTRDFVELLEGPNSHLFRTFRDLCVKTFIALRRHCMELILMVEMLKTGNEELKCFRGRPDDAIQQLRERFRLDLNDRACREYVNSLVDDSIENWRTDWYDRYQRYFVGVL